MYGAIRRAVSTVYDLPVEAIVLIRPGTTAKTSSGKIQRGASKAAYLNGALQVIAQWRRPSSVVDVEQVTGITPVAEMSQLKAIELFLMQRISALASLAPTAIDPLRPFAEYGLGSLDATMLAGELGSHFGLEVAPTAFYDHPSIRQLALELSGTSVAACSACVTSDGPDDDTIVVVGMACRFPGADQLSAYWKVLAEGVSTTTERILSDGRLRHGGFLDNVGGFDHEFFTVSQREAACIDPQQRIALEVTWQALEDAGIRPEQLGGSNAGVFFGASAFDYGALQLGEGALDAYSCQGSSLAVIANRIAYQFDLRGPSFVVDTACSSALTALHLAARSLRDGECELALAGAVNILLAADWDLALTKAGMLAPDGRCKTFDAAANGYVRSEGCGVLVLKRQADAVRDGDRIYGAILGSALNQDGRSNGLTAPNGQAQEALLRRALSNASVSAAELGYIEAHGTGTPLGDPIECGALRRVLGARARPCLVGSVKANLGHLEAAAGMAGMIKTLLALHHDLIPAQVQFAQLNPLIELGDALAIPRAAIPWPRPSRGRRCALVSAFGFSGANACVVVGDGLVADTHVVRKLPAPSVLPFVLSARDQPALLRLASRYADALGAIDEQEWAHAMYTVACRRSVQTARFSAVVDGPTALAARLHALMHSGDGGPASAPARRIRPRVALVFSGQGIPLAGVARELHFRLPPFRAALARCNAVLEPILGHSLYTLLYDTPIGVDLERPALAQPLHFALQYALSQTFLGCGIQPDIVLGHSLGEYAALVVAGAMTPEVALRLVAARGQLTESLAAAGSMATVFADHGTVLKAIAGSRLALDVAALNGEHHCVVAGTAQEINAFCEYMTETRTAEYRKLGVARAYHSALIDPIIPPFRALAEQCQFDVPQTPLISNVSGSLWPAGQALDADYLACHLRQPVRFADALDTLAKAQTTLAIEIGSKPVLCSIAQAHLDQRGPRWVPALRHNGHDWRTWLECLSTAYNEGVEVCWTMLFEAPRVCAAPLPPYAFAEHQHWFTVRADMLEHQRPDRWLPESGKTLTQRPENQTILVEDPAKMPLLQALTLTLARLMHKAPATINPADTFFELGVDSIVLMEFLRITNQVHGSKLSAADIVEHCPSIELVAVRIRSTVPFIATAI
ncbi:Erythronolide synthase, modules 1 and 2 [compost metagenome]